MSKTISVKVSTQKLIKALEAALAKREKEMMDYEKAQKAYEIEKKKFDAEVLSLVGTKKMTLTDSTVWKNHYRDDKPKAQFTFDISDSVKFPQEPEKVSYALKGECDEIRNALQLLKMTDEEYVGTSTYKGVAQYI